MKSLTLLRSIRMRATHREITGPLQSRSFQHDFVPADPKAKPKKYKLPPFYDPHPKMQSVSVDGVDLGAQGGSGPGAAKTEEKVEKTAFDIKLEKFDAAAKIKVIKEVRAFTNLGLKEAKDMVEKVPVLIKQGVSKEEANEIIEKIKAAGGVAVME
ncbi:putative ribosomal protein L7/L12 [Helianthus annuus]|nr:putative ribosomal protein L7/L12 [Helianthus annuus]